MSKMSKLDFILKEAEEHTQALVSCINEIRVLYSGAKESAPKKETKSTPEPEEKPPTLEELRANLADLARKGHTQEIQAMLLRHGYKKISEVPAAEYPAILEEARSLE
nr:MAG TPA: hypothetical protein [Caudoviricetes sp.]